MEFGVVFKKIIFKKKVCTFAFLFFVVTLCYSKQNPTTTSITFPSFFSNDMILQRDVECNIWGTGTAMEQLIIKIANKEIVVLVDESGNWKSKLPIIEAGGPYKLEIIGSNEFIEINNIVFGDVWIASGQSNMDMALAAADNYEEEILMADLPNIRFFTVPLSVSNIPQKDIQNAKWVMSSTKTAGRFSAVAYYFAKKLNKDLNVPIGIMQSSVGGTPAEFWTSKEMLNIIPEFQNGYNEKTNNPEPYFLTVTEVNQKRHSIMMKASEDVLAIKAKSNFDDWDTMDIPNIWENVGLLDFDGFVWFKKTIEIPKKYAGKSLKLSLETIDDNVIQRNT